VPGRVGSGDGTRRRAASSGLPNRAAYGLPLSRGSGSVRPCPIADNALAMSPQNVDIVHAGYEAWNSGDMDALRELYDPEAILRLPEGWPEPGPYVGREAVMREIEQWRETFGTYVTELIGDMIEAADRVVVRQVWHGVGRGPEAHLESTVVFTLREGRISYQEFFWDHAEALETLGLSAEGASTDSS
jgi:ketosteroid isomerase-like protein